MNNDGGETTGGVNLAKKSAPTHSAPTQIGYNVTLRNNMDCHDHAKGRIVRVTEILEVSGKKVEYKGKVISEDQKGNTVTFCDKCKENVLTTKIT